MTDHPLQGVPYVPGMLVQPAAGILDTSVTIPNNIFPNLSFTRSRYDAEKRKMPQCIAHRGYRAKFPENTIAAFKGAVAAGAHALETDVHITKDDVVVMSHDATLKRCFGQPEKIISKTWDELRQLRTIATPHEPMPRLTDVLDYLSQPGLDDTWLLLDIKMDNDAESIMRLIGKTIAATPETTSKPWHERIVLGIWAAKYLPLAQKYVPGFSVMHIGFSVPYARHFFDVPNVGFNMLLPVLVAPRGRKFIRDVQDKYDRQLLAWTVNSADKMEWCIRRKLDGVITDDPVLFLEVCRKHDRYVREKTWSLKMHSYYDIWKVYVWVTVAAWLYRRRFQPVASRALIHRR